MVARVSTIAFQGIEGVPVEVQVMVAPGKIGINIVGLPDKAVAEPRAGAGRPACLGTGAPAEEGDGQSGASRSAEGGNISAIFLPDIL